MVRSGGEGCLAISRSPRSPSSVFGVSSAPPKSEMLPTGAMNGLGSGGPVMLELVLAELPWYVRNGDVGEGVGNGR